MAVTVKLIPSTIALSNTQYLSVSGASNAYHDVSNTTYATVTNSRTSTTTYFAYVRGFNFSSVPNDAIINSFTIKVKARESGVVTSTSTSYAPCLLNGSRAISGTYSTTAPGTSETTITIPSGSLTWETIKGYGSDFGIRLCVRRSNRNTTAYLYIYGAEISVTYTLPVYHTVTVTGAEPSGANSIIEGTEFKAKGYNYSSKPTVTDNGADVTSQVVLETATTEPTIEAVSGTSYTFVLNSNNYYESNNKAHSNSAALCKVIFDLPGSATVTFSVINYAESTYDYGLLSNIDTMLSTSASADSSGVYWDGKNHNSSSVQTVSYTMSAGEHFICVKYFKDSYTDSNNDSLQFKVSVTLDDPSLLASYWAYTIASVVADHVIVYSAGSFVKKIWKKESGSWQEINYTKVYKKVNGVWVEQSDVSTAFESGVNYVWGS